MPEARFSTAESARSNEEGIRLTGFANPGQDEHGYLPLSPDVVEASGIHSLDGQENVSFLQRLLQVLEDHRCAAVSVVMAWMCRPSG